MKKPDRDSSIHFKTKLCLQRNWQNDSDLLFFGKFRNELKSNG